MGMLAKYYAIEADQLEAANGDLLSWAFEHEPEVDIDKAWDGIHFLLTGHSAMSMMAEGTPASLGIIGDPIEARPSDGLLNLISPEEVAGFVAAVGDKTLEDLRAAYDADALRTSDVYIGRALADDGRDFAVGEYLYPNFEALVGFYRRIEGTGAWVMVLID